MEENLRKTGVEKPLLTDRKCLDLLFQCCVESESFAHFEPDTRSLLVLFYQEYREKLS